MGLTTIVPEGAGTVTEVEVPLDPSYYYAGSHYLILTATPNDDYEFDRFEWDYDVVYPDSRPPAHNHYVVYNNPTSSPRTPTWWSAPYGIGTIQVGTSSNLKAYFKPKTEPKTKFNVLVEIAPNNAGTVDGGGEFEEGSSCTITTEPKCSLWIFDHWELSTGETYNTQSVTFTVTADVTCTAVFRHENTGQLIYDADGSGSLICAADGNLLYDGDLVSP